MVSETIFTEGNSAANDMPRSLGLSTIRHQFNLFGGSVEIHSKAGYAGNPVRSGGGSRTRSRYAITGLRTGPVPDELCEWNLNLRGVV